jgi:hypothetical protein
MFGDYQVIKGYRSTECYTSCENKDTYAMCLKKSVLLNLLEMFPEAKVYYKERARQRRIEFRKVI